MVPFHSSLAELVVTVRDVNLLKPTTCFITCKAISKNQQLPSIQLRSETVIKATKIKFQRNIFSFTLDKLIHPWMIQLNINQVKKGQVLTCWTTFKIRATSEPGQTQTLPLHLEGTSVGTITCSWNWKDFRPEAPNLSSTTCLYQNFKGKEKSKI